MILTEIWRVWKYALGSFNDRTTKKYDNWIAIIRSLVMFQLIVTNCFIIGGNIRHWNDIDYNNSINTRSNETKRQIPTGQHRDPQQRDTIKG